MLLTGAILSGARIDGSLVYKGTIDAASPPDLTTAKKGDYYKISGAGTLAGVAVQVDDSIIFNQDASSPLTSAMFDVIDSSALGTASAEDVGTSIGDVVQLENVGGSAGLPAVDGSQLTNVTATATVPDASETVKGIIEIATNVEAAAGTATDKALVPSNVGSLSIASSQVTGLATVATSGAYADLSGTPTTATTTTEGIIELSDNTEAASGTATDKALTPANVSSLSIGSGQITGLATVATSGAYADLSGTPTTATETTEGIIEISTNAEATAGTATDRALVPSNISSISVGQLSDVDLTGIANTELLAYNSTSGNFEPTSPTSVPDASETVKGIIEIATNTEAGAGTATDKALVPSNIASFSIASSQLTGLAAVATSGAYADLSGVPTTATTTVEGIIETATDAEATAGTANDKALTPANIDAISAGQLSDINLSGVATNNFLKYSGSEFQPTTDGTALTIEVSSDTSPQLGGNLDTAGNSLVTTSNADLLLEPNGTGLPKVTGTATRAGGVKFTEATDTYAVTISASNSQSANYSLTLPPDAGSNSQLLSTDGSGLLSWTDALLVAQNLADLNNVVTARSNLGLGTAAVLDVGTSANNIVQLNGSAQLPALDGSNLTSVTAAPPTVSAQTTSFTAVENNYYRMSPTGAITVTLPTATAAGNGAEIELKLATAQTVTIDVASASGDLIDGASSYTLDVQWSAIRLKSNGSSIWDVL